MGIVNRSMKRNRTVTKSNELIRASYKLTVNEQRLILSCSAQLDPRKPIEKTHDDDIKPMRITVEYFVERKDRMRS